MANCTNMLMNPWVLHLQKLGLELKCPLCLKLLNQPVLLPCDHVFCDSCIHESSQVESGCPVCKSKHPKKARRNLHFMECVIGIYKSLNAAVSVHLPQLQIRNDGRSEDSEMTDKDVIKRGGGSDSSGHDGSPLPTSEESNRIRPKHHRDCTTAGQMLDNLESFEFESENDAGNHTPESHIGPAAKGVSDISASGQLDNKAARRRICGDHDDSPLSMLQESPPNQDLSVRLMTESLRSYDFHPESDNDHLKSHKHQLPESLQAAKRNWLDQYFVRPLEKCCIIQEECQWLEMTYSLNVIHVHKHLNELFRAPQVYFEGDTVRNLKAELARGLKMKCTKCSLKGAALGCYVKSCRRSYHAPCAREISRCRWDYEDFLLLCPAHSSVKFPNEKSRHRTSRAEPLPKINPAELCSLDKKPDTTKDLVLCGSALSQSDKRLMEKLAAEFNATISRYWNPSVTHVIASTDEKGACTRTLKVLMGILNGKWIINADWMKASLEASQPVDEEPFEIHIDTQGCQDGPKTARLRAATNKPKLFDGMKFCFYGDFFKGYKEDLQNLVKVAGAERSNNVGDQRSSPVVVYNIDPPPGCGLGEEVTIIWQRANEAEALSTKTGSRVVGHTWLLESIAGYKLHPMITT
ncbi:hypothetical protein Bca52824_095237 [Brassica carinata]|uniref:Uncharacterized protein n=1 Tax=Brassica carinata TaxID=52824 RepID=A0A8X7P3V1_BRACI|nr:hypothetical protein Bca52824_095237 [Brassica carinata]